MGLTINIFFHFYFQHHNKMINQQTIKKIDAAFERGKEAKEVDLRNQGIQDAGFIHLLTKKETEKVVKLYLDGNQLSSFFMLRISEAKWGALTQLSLEQNNIRVKGCKYLLRVRIPQIDLIFLGSNKITSLGCQHLAKAEWKQLEMIYLRQNEIGAEGVKVLSSAKWSKAFNTIHMPSNEMFLGEIQRLILCDMPQLKYIYVQRNKVEEQCYKHKLRCTLELKFALETQQVQTRNGVIQL